MMRNYGKVVGSRLQEWRRQKGWRLRDESRRMGVSVATISQWEHGLRFPSADHLARLSELFGRPICLLFCPGKRRCPLYRQGLLDAAPPCAKC